MRKWHDGEPKEKGRVPVARAKVWQPARDSLGRRYYGTLILEIIGVACRSRCL